MLKQIIEPLGTLTQGSLALKLNNEQNVINGKARMP
jgi:hypothetical protein